MQTVTPGQTPVDREKKRKSYIPDSRQSMLTFAPNSMRLELAKKRPLKSAEDDTSGGKQEELKTEEVKGEKRSRPDG